ncbi:MAG TPA: hypothetical protein PKO33_11365, partial [Pyrinomonadaceae bacterium]|nr:hypothetical protein [Pyrinomonadaceae bacterium]
MKFMFSFRMPIVTVLVVFAVVAAFGQTSRLSVRLDASAAPRNYFHVSETVDAKPGPFWLFYPKWIPGEHSPTGMINDMVNLRFTANGQVLEWERDDVEMFAFRVNVPDGISRIDVDFDYVSQSNSIATPNLARIKWNRFLLYPRGVPSDDIEVTAEMKMPDGWKFATALPVDKENARNASFKPVTLTNFVDSPAIIGKYFSKVVLRGGPVPVEMDIAAESEDGLKYKPITLAGWKKLVTQAESTFGARHYNSYKFLLTLSGEGGFEGLEHHESSENGVGGDALSSQRGLLDLAELLGHEYTHSWNGKYRRPARLATPDFEQPMHGDLLWVYEGLTQYMGKVLSARSGLWTESMFRESFAQIAAEQGGRSGRQWRPLVDTARAVQFTYDSPRMWRNMRRGADYYDEGALIWLEADVLIREKSGGTKSLDDFLHAFHGGISGGPKLVTYTFDDVVRTLNDVQPFDWRSFFIERVYKVKSGAPVGGIDSGGWKLVYTSEENLQAQVQGSDGLNGDHMFSIGMDVSADGEILDINPDLPAAKSGLAPGMLIRTLNGQEFTVAALKLAVGASLAGAQNFVVEAQNGDQRATYKFTYSGGERYPHIVRDTTKKDLLTAIPKPVRESGPVVSRPAGRQGAERQPALRNPPNVSKLILERKEHIATCSNAPDACPPNARPIEVRAEAENPDNDAIIFDYKPTAGRIVGQGPRVFWNLDG